METSAVTPETARLPEKSTSTFSLAEVTPLMLFSTPAAMLFVVGAMPAHPDRLNTITAAAALIPADFHFVILIFFLLLAARIPITGGSPGNQ